MRHVIRHSAKHSVDQLKNAIGLVQNAVTLVQGTVTLVKATGIHKPIVHAGRGAYRVATHPITRTAAKAGWAIGATTSRAIYRVATHPTTARITHKAWLHGTKAARHTARFMVKIAAKGFKLRT
jgi:hypothetical protein